MGFLPCFDVYNAAYDLYILFIINFFIRRELLVRQNVEQSVHVYALQGIYTYRYVPPFLSLSLFLSLSFWLSLCINVSIDSSLESVAIHLTTAMRMGCIFQHLCNGGGRESSAPLMSLTPRRTHGATINCAPQKAIRVQCEKPRWLRCCCWLHANSGHEG